MPSSDSKPKLPILPAGPTSSANEANRTKSVATRLTEAEFTEVESAAASAGKKVGEWLRDAALAQARNMDQQCQTDPVLLADTITRSANGAASKQQSGASMDT